MQNLRNTQDEFEPAAGPLHRIGAVSRLSGVPVSTLRVWESRYGAFQPAKSSGQHRLYADADVIKARLLRQLTSAGHSVGGIAGLAVPALQKLLDATGAQAAQAQSRPGPAPLPLVLVGASVSARINTAAWRERHLGVAIEVRATHADLDAAEEAEAAGPAPAAAGACILVAKLNIIDASVYQQLLRVVGRLRAQRAVVLYNYGATPLVDALRGAGMVVRREPATDEDLAELVRSVRMVDVPASMPALGRGALIPPRRFSEELLARVASSPNRIVCECPRHIAELIGQLAAFEDYSARCLNDSGEDARLHAYLRSVAGSARALFEHALELAASHAGLELGPGDAVLPPPAGTAAA